jgi:hypothetical protein
MPQDPFIREKFTRERTAAKKLAAEYFARFPKDRYQTEVEQQWFVGHIGDDEHGRSPG